ncbi:MAG: hypothetical protein AB7V77_05890 [Candidatus Woesearchaeota archaeon]
MTFSCIINKKYEAKMYNNYDIQKKREVNQEQIEKLNKEIHLIEELRNSYDSCSNKAKGILFLFQLYKINDICKKIATKEIFDITSKVLISFFLYFSAHIFNELFISKGYTTGVNILVILFFCLFTIYFILSKYNQKTRNTLEYSQQILREQKFNLLN